MLTQHTQNTARHPLQKPTCDTPNTRHTRTHARNHARKHLQAHARTRTQSVNTRKHTTQANSNTQVHARTHTHDIFCSNIWKSQHVVQEYTDAEPYTCAGSFAGEGELRRRPHTDKYARTHTHRQIPRHAHAPTLEPLPQLHYKTRTTNPAQARPAMPRWR